MESGSVVSGYLKHPLVAFPFPPELVGGKVSVILGKKSGRHSIQHKLSELGFPPLSLEAIGRILERVKESAESTGAPVGDGKFADWATAEVAAGGASN
jgi:isopropylmalate/homocitrate/citramalate synthase